MLTYIGGMQTTLAATNAPSRIVDPPGTMRTPARDAGLLQRHRVLVVEGPPAVIAETSTSVAEAESEQDPLLHPGLTRHPVGDAASGSAARTVPPPSARCSSKKASRAAALSAAFARAKSDGNGLLAGQALAYVAAGSGPLSGRAKVGPYALNVYGPC